MIYIISGIIVFIAIIIVIIFTYRNKFHYILLKIQEGEENIENYLLKKIEFIKNIIPIIREKTKEKDFLDDFSLLEDKNSFEKNEILKNNYVEIIKILEDHETLLNDKNFNELINEIEDNEEELVASIKFYNDNTLEYNHLIESFPSNILRIFFHLKRKDLYSNEKKEIYEILKQK